jgi:uncharacterized protein YsxB (DUF464 family)
LINIHLELDEDRCLKNLKVSGHEQLKGQDYAIVCTAVTFLFRTVAHAVTNKKELAALLNAPKPGILELRIDKHHEKWIDWLKGVTDILLTGIFDLQTEYPGAIKFNK